MSGKSCAFMNERDVKENKFPPVSHAFDGDSCKKELNLSCITLLQLQRTRNNDDDKSFFLD